MQHFSNPVQQTSALTQDDLKHVYNHLPRPLSHDNLLFLIMLLVCLFGLLCLGSSFSLTPPLFALQQRPDGGDGHVEINDSRVE